MRFNPITLRPTSYLADDVDVELNLPREWQSVTLWRDGAATCIDRDDNEVDVSPFDHGDLFDYLDRELDEYAREAAEDAAVERHLDRIRGA